MKTVVAVIGPAVCTADEAAQAERVGGLLAQRGAVLLCGGRGGVMEAASKGAAEAGGIAIGILPGPDWTEGNRYLTVALATDFGQARNALVATAGQAAIAIGGRLGTLSEIALALKAGRRVIGLDTWSGTSPAGEGLDILVAQDAEQAVTMALAEDESG